MVVSEKLIQSAVAKADKMGMDQYRMAKAIGVGIATWYRIRHKGSVRKKTLTQVEQFVSGEQTIARMREDQAWCNVCETIISRKEYIKNNWYCVVCKRGKNNGYPKRREREVEKILAWRAANKARYLGAKQRYYYKTRYGSYAIVADTVFNLYKELNNETKTKIREA